MRSKTFFKNGCMVLTFLFNALLLSAQADFSGTWILDNAKSDAMYRDFKVTYIIKQTPETITISRAYGDSNSERPEVYPLNGKVTESEEEGGINKQWIKWSDDRKILTLSNTRTVGSELYGSNAKHWLSPDGRVLTVEVSNARTDDKKVIMEVYNRK